MLRHKLSLCLKWEEKLLSRMHVIASCDSILLMSLSKMHVINKKRSFLVQYGGGGNGFTRPILGDGGADQLRGVPVIGRLPTEGDQNPEVIGYGRIWPDADGPAQGSLGRDVKDSVI